MHLADLIQPEMVWATLEAKTKPEVINELASRIAKHLGSPDEHRIAEILAKRERLGSTGIQDGIAIPHGKVPGLEKTIVACGRSIHGIDFDAHDAKPTHLFFVLLAPESAAGVHLKALARLSRILKDTGFRERLMASSNAQDMYRTIILEDEKA